MKGVRIVALSKHKFGNNLEYYITKNGETQASLAQAINVTKQAVSRWVLGERFPRVETINAIAEHFGVTPEELLGIGNSSLIPVLGHVHAGQTTYAIEEILDYVDIGSLKASQGEYFGLYVEGDSMLPELHDGDLVIVRKQPTLETGDIGVFSIGDNETTIKEYQELSRFIALMPFNTEYDGLMISHKEVAELPVLILGKVVEARRSYV